MKNNIKETIVILFLIIIAILLLNPFNFWMPDMLVMTMLVLILVLFAIFASFILREKMIDEREERHRSLAGRNAFLVGSAVIIIGIVVEGYSHNVDKWLVIVLVIMIITKVYTRFWSDKHR